MPSPHHRDAAASPRRQQVLIGLEILLWITSSATLLFVAGSLTSRLTYQATAADQLARKQASASVAASAERIGTRPVVEPGTPLARLRVPRLGIDAVVAEGASDEVLARAVGHLPHSALPGADGNVALAAHRDSFFRPLRDLRVGDRVELHSGGEVHRYQVTWMAVVDPERIDVVGPTSEDALTLVTCYPFRYLGSAPRRFVARAEVVRDDPRRPAAATAGAGG